jgi:hypothetical protein
MHVPSTTGRTYAEYLPAGGPELELVEHILYWMSITTSFLQFAADDD